MAKKWPLTSLNFKTDIKQLNDEFCFLTNTFTHIRAEQVMKYNQEKLDAILKLNIFTQYQLCSIFNPPVLLPTPFSFARKFYEGERVLLMQNSQKNCKMYTCKKSCLLWEKKLNCHRAKTPTPQATKAVISTLPHRTTIYNVS